MLFEERRLPNVFLLGLSVAYCTCQCLMELVLVRDFNASVCDGAQSRIEQATTGGAWEESIVAIKYVVVPQSHNNQYVSSRIEPDQWGRKAHGHQDEEWRRPCPPLDVGGRDTTRARARRTQVSIAPHRYSRCVLSPTEPTAPQKPCRSTLGPGRARVGATSTLGKAQRERASHLSSFLSSPPCRIRQGARR